MRRFLTVSGLCLAAFIAGYNRVDKLIEVAPASDAYNCIAFSIGQTDRWVQGDLKEVFAEFETCDEDQATIAVYSEYHAARKIYGRWYSKMGKGPVVVHGLRDDAITQHYGQPVTFYH